MTRAIFLPALLVVSALLCACGGTDTPLVLSAAGGVIQVELANPTAAPLVLLRDGGLGAPRSVGVIELQVSQGGRTLTPCIMIDSASNLVRIAPGKQHAFRFRQRFVEKLFCVAVGPYDLAAMYDNGGHPLHSKTLSLQREH